DDCANCAADALITACGGPPRDEAGFGRLRDRARAELPDAVRAVLGHVHAALAVAQQVEVQLTGLTGAALRSAADDARAQLAALVGPGFVTATGAQQLPELPRYLRALERRLGKLRTDPDRDRELMRRIETVTAAYRQLLEDLGAGPEPARIRWMIEELRVSYFAQELRTPYPISDKRIYRAIEALRAS
ncbi:MAG TPA: DUF3418 domain-containing protein, partial [Pseudonocardiaceae bacterium]|nr:DUF3418 domain-containing protein [Pseudonocardiaceae bacterium]